VDGPGCIETCCNLLVRYKVLGVRGNHERWMFTSQMRSLRGATRLNSLARRARAFLTSFPQVRDIQTAGGTIIVAHGIGTDDMRGIPRSPDHGSRGSPVPLRGPRG
jgi:hypothetical protein